MGLRLVTGLLAAVFVAFPSRAQDSPLSKGFQYFYNLDYDEAITEFVAEIAEKPQAPEGYNHVAQAILYREMHRAGTLETALITGNDLFFSLLHRPKINLSAEDDKRFGQALQQVMDLAQDRLKNNPNDAGALYDLGVAYGLRADYSFLVQKAWKAALRDGTTARKLHNKVTILDPSNADARLIQGIHDYIVSGLPLGYRLLGFLIGFRGDKEAGIQAIESVAKSGRGNQVEAEILLTALYRHEKKPQLALPLLESLLQRFPRNYLLRFQLAQAYNDLGNERKALESLHILEELRMAGARGYTGIQPEKIYYARGNIQFRFNDLDQALENMKRVTAKEQGSDLNTGAWARLRVGQIYDLKGQRALALQSYHQAIASAPNSDAGKTSQRYLSKPYRKGEGPGAL